MSATTSIAVAETPRLATYLAMADDALILGHRLSEWCGHAPMPEEDLALANIALDLIGRATSLYDHAATLEGAPRRADDYAFLRDAPQFRNVLLVECPNGDFAETILRLLLFAGFARLFWAAAREAADPAIAAIAAKSLPEAAYHWRHAAEWTIRLGDGTTESHRRADSALARLFPYAGELFEALAAPEGLPDPAALRADWDRMIDDVLAEATLTRPAPPGRFQSGGRRGIHTEHLSLLLAVMQSLPRAHPGAAW